MSKRFGFIIISLPFLCMILPARFAQGQLHTETKDPAYVKEQIRSSAYIDLLIKHIKRAWFPPSSLTPSQTIELVLDRNGDLIYIKLKKAAQNAWCNRALLKAVITAAPFPPLPGEDTEYEIFDFNVKDKWQVVKAEPVTAKTKGFYVDNYALKARSPIKTGYDFTKFSNQEGIAALVRADFEEAAQWFDDAQYDWACYVNSIIASELNRQGPMLLKNISPSAHPDATASLEEIMRNHGQELQRLKLQYDNAPTEKNNKLELGKFAASICRNPL
jgi:hypothetical protein